MPLINSIKVVSRLVKRREFYSLIFSNLNSKNKLPQTDLYIHLNAAIDWLLRANEICQGKGYAKIFSFYSGWWGPYIETTGYIIPTLYNFISKFNYRSEEIREAIRLSGNWLLQNQFENGAFGDSISNQPTITVSNKPMVFDTGQVIFGLLAIYEKEMDEKFLIAAQRAGDWICSIQEKDGSWIKHTYSENHRTYYSRVSWALCELWRVTGQDKYRTAAERQLQWAVDQQQSNGAFKLCSFEKDAKTVLHVIAYTIEGLWRSGVVLNETKFQNAAVNSAKTLIEIQKRDNILFGSYDLNWNPSARYRCMTGLAQMADIWLMMYESCGDKSYLEQARESLYFLKGKQIISKKIPNLYGGLLGSDPWWGDYFSWAIPNWGLKFFIDAMLREKSLTRE
jgi:hypothetical protein